MVASFDPLSVGTPKLWLDATQLTSTGEGTAVTAMVDRASVSTVTISGGQQPTYDAVDANYAGAPTWDNNGSKVVKITNHGLTNTAITIVIVGDGGDGLWMQDSNGNLTIYGGGGAGAEIGATFNAFGNYIFGGGPATTAGVYIAVLNGASSKVYRSALTPTTGSTGTPSDLTGLTIGVGNSVSPGGGQVGSMRHVLIYAGALSQANVAYLLAGFGLESGITIGA